MKKLILVVVSIFCSGYLLEAGAQVYTNPVPPQTNMPNVIWSNFRVGQIGNQIAADLARGNAGVKRKTTARTAVKTTGRTAGKSTAKPAAVRPANNTVKPAAMRPANNPVVYSPQFSFSRSSRSLLAEKLVQAGGANNSLNAGQADALLGKLWSDYETSFKEENQRLRMPYNDVATAMTYFIEINYMTSRGIPSIKAENSVAIYRQVSSVLLQNAEFSKLSASDKQLMAEILVTMGGFPSLVFSQNRNFAQQKTLSEENLARIFGANAKNLQITEQGIEF